MKRYDVRRAASLVLLLLCLFSLIGCGPAPKDPVHILEGKTISIMGDSISTFDGVSNDGEINSTLTSNAVYYKNGFYGFKQHDTWWQQAANLCGAEILVNNSWSGSTTFLPQKGEGSQGYRDRSVNLHDNSGREPDIVAIYLGTNDFNTARAAYGSPANINYDTLVAADGSYKDPETFCEAYALMLARIKHRYPNAEIYCFTILDRKDLKGNTDRISYFNGFIKTIAQNSGAYIVDLYKDSGISGSDLSYAAHIVDDYLHPSPAGMDAIAHCFISSIYENSRYVDDSIKTHHVDYRLKETIVIDGQPTVVQDGTSLEFTLSAGRDVPMDITVTMGGKDVTRKYVCEDMVSIPVVTGDVVITASR